MSFIVSALFYGFSLLFFTINNTWAIPVVLSPSQEKVLTHQAQVANFIQNLEKQKIELLNSEESLSANKILLENALTIKGRLVNSINKESARLASFKERLTVAANEQKRNIQKSREMSNKLRETYKSTEQELEAGLITKDQATLRLKDLQLSDTQVTSEDLKLRKTINEIEGLDAFSNTLKGSSTDLKAVDVFGTLAELDRTIVDLKVQNLTDEASIKSLRESIKESNKILDIMKNSPYYLALKESINVSFAPYENTKQTKKGQPVYTCYLQMILCKKVGSVSKIYPAEEYTQHPIFKTQIKGQFINIDFDEKKYAKSQIVFVGGKPLLI